MYITYFQFILCMWNTLSNVNLDAHSNDFINGNEIVNKIFKIVISNILHRTNAWVYI